MLPAGTVGDSANPTRAHIRALDFANTLRNDTYNSGFRSRQLIKKGDETVTMFLLLSFVLRSNRGIGMVM